MEGGRGVNAGSGGVNEPSAAPSPLMTHFKEFYLSFFLFFFFLSLFLFVVLFRLGFGFFLAAGF